MHKIGSVYDLSEQSTFSFEILNTVYLSYNPNSRSKSLKHYTRAKQMRKKNNNQPIVRYSFVPSIGRFRWFETMTAGITNSEFENV